MTTAENPRSVAIVGAGPVGALMAVYLANRGWNVHVYETRPGTLNTKLSLFVSVMYCRTHKKGATWACALRIILWYPSCYYPLGSS